MDLECYWALALTQLFDLHFQKKYHVWDKACLFQLACELKIFAAKNTSPSSWILSILYYYTLSYSGTDSIYITVEVLYLTPNVARSVLMDRHPELQWLLFRTSRYWNIIVVQHAVVHAESNYLPLLTPRSTLIAVHASWTTDIGKLNYWYAEFISISPFLSGNQLISRYQNQSLAK